jgi:hypothetical protein
VLLCLLRSLLCLYAMSASRHHSRQRQFALQIMVSRRPQPYTARRVMVNRGQGNDHSSAIFTMAREGGRKE